MLRTTRYLVRPGEVLISHADLLVADFPISYTAAGELNQRLSTESEIETPGTNSSTPTRCVFSDAVFECRHEHIYPLQIARNRLGHNDTAHELAVQEAEKERQKKEKEERELEKEKKGKRRS